MVSRQQQENPPKQQFQGLGIDFSILSSVINNIHSSQQDPLLDPLLFSLRSCRLPLAPSYSISDLSFAQGHCGSGVISLNHQIMRRRKASNNVNTANRLPSGSETTSVHMEVTLPVIPGGRKPQTKENLAAVITQCWKVLPGAPPFHKFPWKTCKSIGVGDCIIYQTGKENQFYKSLIVKVFKRNVSYCLLMSLIMSPNTVF